VQPINLLPERFRPARATGQRPGIGYAALAGLAVLLLMVLGLVVTHNQTNSAKEKADEAAAQAAQAQARIQQLGAFANFRQVKLARETAVRNLALTRFDFERVMRELALVLPKDVFLTSFQAGPGGAGGETASAGATTTTAPTLTLAGCASGHKEVATTIVRLRQLHDVTDVTLNSSAKGTAGGGAAPGGAACEDSWSAILTFTAPVSAPATRVPARLGGGA
jgi:Tfp pilus assembly protein PilN